MKKIQILLGLFFAAFTFVSCDPSDDNSGSGSNFTENFGNTASRNFIGQIVDTDNHPLQNVTVKIGTSTVQTDVNGVFIVNNATVYEKFAYITAKKAGYIDGSRSMIPTTGKNNVKIMLIPNLPLQTVQSGVTSEVSIVSGTKVKFDGAFQDENGNSYTGAVQVSMFHLTPSDENLNSLMPGMLYAETQNGNEAILETFGMLNVELRGSGGQKLNIANGHTAEITVRIDDSQLATAPNTIPLWHFDEDSGYWKEDGAATKIGNKYVGTVSHFSWWNYDAQFPTVILTVTVVDANGNPLSNVGVGLVRTTNNYGTMGFTDNNGHVSGLIPSNESLILNVYADYYTCTATNIIYTASVGPFTSDATLPNIVVNNTASVLSSNVIGTLLKCDNTNVTNGYIMLSRAGGTSVASVTNGAFSFNEMYCPGNTQFSLKGVDFDNLQETDSINYNFSVPITNIGGLQACNTINEFISYKIDNNATVFLTNSPTAGLEGASALYIYAGSPTQNGLSIYGNGIVPGLYTTAQFSIEGNGIGYIGSATTNAIQFNLTHFGLVGEYIDMTFNGTYNDTNGISHTLTGVAHIIRDN